MGFQFEKTRTRTRTISCRAMRAQAPLWERGPAYATGNPSPLEAGWFRCLSCGGLGEAVAAPGEPKADAPVTGDSGAGLGFENDSSAKLISYHTCTNSANPTHPGEWHVEMIDEEGCIYLAVFIGSDAEQNF